MKVTSVKRYHCDFCKKKTLQSAAMKRHETYCTLNPNRGCRVCNFTGGGKDLPDLIAMLPDPTSYNEDSASGKHYALCEQLDAVFDDFKEAAQGCPACMMAALRQKKIPVPMVEKFDFKKMMQSIFAEVNLERAEIAGYYY